MSFVAANQEVFVAGDSVDDGRFCSAKHDLARFPLHLLTVQTPSIEAFASVGVVAGATKEVNE